MARASSWLGSGTIIVLVVCLVASTALAQDFAGAVDHSTGEIIKQGILGIFCLLFIGIAFMKDREGKAAVREAAVELKAINAAHAAELKAVHEAHASALEEKDEAILKLSVDTAKERAEMVSVLRRHATNT